MRDSECRNEDSRRDPFLAIEIHNPSSTHTHFDTSTMNMKQVVRSGRSQPSVPGAVFFLVVAYTALSCAALSLPPRFIHNAGRGNNLGGGGKSPPPWHRLNCHDGGDENDRPSNFNLASFWIVSSSCDEDDEHVPSHSSHVSSSIPDGQSTKDTYVLRTRGGDAAVKQKTTSSNKNVADSINDALDSLQKIIIRPFQVVGQHIPSSLLNKKKDDPSSASAKDEEQILRSTKILSVRS